MLSHFQQSNVLLFLKVHPENIHSTSLGPHFAACDH